jgi:hypothetical protein
MNGGGNGREGDSLITFPDPNSIPTFSPTRRITNQPTVQPGPIDYDFRIECSMEQTIDSGVFIVPCNSINFRNFRPQDLRRSVRFRFIITNKSTEPINIPNLIMDSDIINTPAKIILPTDGIQLGVGMQKEFVRTFVVPFGNFNNRNIEVDATVDAVGANSAQSRSDEDQYFISVP